jgi:hypothetical protein
MLSSLVGLLASTMLVTASLAPPAVAATARVAPAKPCGGWTLQVTHAASADFFDRNGDRLECLRTTAPGSEPSPVEGRDNVRLPLSRGFKLYHGESIAPSGTGIVSVRPRRNLFSARLATQEDDQDMNGCSGVCFERLRYDRNDLFYVDSGRGSRRVSATRFEARLPGAERLTLIYSPKVRRLSVFSVKPG